MLIDTIFDKGDTCYFLLSSYNSPNILIPGRGIINDITFQYSKPVYQIKINKLYDNISFIKDNLYNMFFYTKFNQTHKVKLNLEVVDSIIDLNSYLLDNNITVIINSLMVFDSKEELMEYFNKLNYYFITLNMYNLKQSTMRSSYTGFLKINSHVEFRNKMKLFIGDDFIDGITFEQYMRSIEDTKPINAIKYKKIKKKKYKRDKTDINSNLKKIKTDN